MPNQYAASIKILDRSLCPLYPPIIPKKMLQVATKVHTVHQQGLFNVRRPTSQWIFSEQDPVFAGYNTNFSIQDLRSTESRKNCVDKIQDPLDPSTKCQPRIQDQSRSWILLGSWHMSAWWRKPKHDGLHGMGATCLWKVYLLACGGGGGDSAK